MALKIFFFGSFELFVNNQLILNDLWPSENTKALLKILSGERGRLFLQDELVEYLWPELDPQRAATNLRGRVTELRKILEPSLIRGSHSQFIHTRHGGYLFSKEAACWTDVEAFSVLESQARKYEKEAKPEEATRCYSEALSLCRGEYLAEDRYAEWALQLRDRWRERRVELLLKLAHSLEQTQSYREAIARLREALALAPLQEELYQEWMRCAHHLGDVFQIRQAYQECEKILTQELGVNPSAQTQQLYENAQTRPARMQPAANQPTLSTLNVGQRSKRAPFVARESEQKTIAALIEAAKMGNGKLVLISGEMGMGKTCLAEEITLWAKSNLNAGLLRGQCYELETPLAFQPLLEALRSSLASFARADFAKVHEAWLAELSELIPELTSLYPSLPQTVVLPAEYKQHRFFEIFLQCLSTRAQRQPPLVLSLEDLQWADPSTLDFLHFLLPKLSMLPMMVLGTYRNEEAGSGHRLHRLLQQGHRLHQLKEICLTALEYPDVRALIESLSIDAKKTPVSIESVMAQCGGNPFFITSYVQALNEQASAQPLQQSVSMDFVAKGGLSTGAAEVLRHRLERLSASRRRVLELVAVCGEKCESSLLEKLWKGTREELQEHLAALTESGLLTADAQGYAYRHLAYRNLVYHTLLNDQRRQWLHRHILSCLKTEEPHLSASWRNRLAYHSEQAGHLLEALAHTITALSYCRQGYENAEALKLIERGQQLLHRVSTQEEQRPWLKKEFLSEQFRLLCEETQVFLQIGERLETDRIIGKLDRFIQEMRDERVKAQAAQLSALLYIRSAHFQKALTSAQTAHALFESLGDALSAAESLEWMAEAHFGAGEYEAAKQCYLDGLVQFEKLDHSQKQLETLNSLGNVWMKLRDAPQALQCYQRALDLAEMSGSERGEGEATQSMGFVYLQLGDYEEVLHMCEKSQAIAEKLGNFRNQLFSLTSKATAYYFLGLFNEAGLACREALQSSERMGNPVEQAQIHRQYGRILRELGEFAESKRHIETALRIFQERAVLHEEAEGWRALAETYLSEGDAPRAQENLDKALEIAQQVQSPLLLHRCHGTAAAIDYARGQYEKACHAADAVLSLVDPSKMGGDGLVKTHFLHFKILCKLGRADEALGALSKAYDLLQAIEQKMTSVTLRESFRNIPWRRELVKAIEEHLKGHS